MKRDLVVLFTCLCILAAAAWFPVPETAQTMAAAADQPAARTLILDPGHGGEDGGAVSASGSKESDVNLGIVLRIDQLMGLCGFSPVLTRDSDRSIHDASADTIREKKVSDIHNRVALVQSFPDAILLSVHQNSYTDPRYSGAQVFYGGAEGSQLWGEYTQEVLRLSLDAANDREAKKIPDSIYLMNHITCPAILVECGFLSNGEEASLLLTPAYQKKLAAALTGACLQYLEMIT